MSTNTYLMDGNIGRTATSRNSDNVELIAYCTSEHVRLGFEGHGVESVVWVDRQQVIEFIAILSHIVYSKPAEVVEPAPVPPPPPDCWPPDPLPTQRAPIGDQEVAF